MNAFYWLLLNIGVPVLGPIFMLALVSPSYGWPVAKRMIFDAVKDGQLFWAAIALSASALYELFTWLDKVKTPIAAALAAAQQAAVKGAVAASAVAADTAPSPDLIFVVQVAIVVFFAIAIVSAGLVMLMGIKAYHDERERQLTAAQAPAAAQPAAPAAPAPAVTASSTRWPTNLKVSFWLTLTSSFLFAAMHFLIG
ncbi:hypothetical protein [Burkholderia guangdongensis]|uniref:hypothetical protein n=1 Tax=Burkholderia guangdongensis TaxID=1792500 RepID=UPI0015CC2724|nr:hypothetical protein [Burkholderia guangdongensis]